MHANDFDVVLDDCTGIHDDIAANDGARLYHGPREGLHPFAEAGLGRNDGRGMNHAAEHESRRVPEVKQGAPRRDRGVRSDAVDQDDRIHRLRAQPVVIPEQRNPAHPRIGGATRIEQTIDGRAAGAQRVHQYASVTPTTEKV